MIFLDGLLGLFITRYTGWKLLLPEEFSNMPVITGALRTVLDALNRKYDEKLSRS